MRKWSVNRTLKELSAPLTEATDERGAACKWFVAAILATAVVLTIAIIALALPEASPLPSCQYYRATKIVVIQDVSNLSSIAKTLIVTAYKKMKILPSVYDSSLNSWDYFVYSYFLAVQKNVTGNWQFLPWQREFGIRFRQELARAINAINDSSKPVNSTNFGYWSWTSNASTASLMDTDFLGGKGNPLEGCLVTDGQFTAENGWPINVSSESAEGLLRCPGNGLQICANAKNTSFYLLDTRNNPRDVDTRDKVGPFVNLIDNTSMSELKPDNSNRGKSWEDSSTLRYYSDNASSQLRCRHYGGTLPTLNDTIRCESLASFGGSDSFSACVMGLNVSDQDAQVVELRGVTLHALYGALRVNLGGHLGGLTPANDPIFPHLLANIDRMWAEFQYRHPNVSEAFISDHVDLDEELPGFAGTTFRSTLKTNDRFYTYDTMCTDYSS